ncbi:MAG: hypothetical protein IJ552_02270 [Prevotella sp.]|nr:hypothetical protein [Prevotella sp.]
MDKIIKTLNFLLSILAVCLSVSVASNQCCINVSSTVLALVGVCATLIVGVSVIDTIALYSTLQKVEKKMTEQNKRLDELGKLDTEIRKMKKQTNILFHHTWGLALEKEQPYAAFAEYWKAFVRAAESDDIKRAKSCLSNAENVVKDITQRKLGRGQLDAPDYGQTLFIVPDEIKDTPVYVAFSDKVDALLTNINQTM